MVMIKGPESKLDLTNDSCYLELCVVLMQLFGFTFSKCVQGSGQGWCQLGSDLAVSIEQYSIRFVGLYLLQHPQIFS